MGKNENVMRSSWAKHHLTSWSWLPLCFPLGHRESLPDCKRDLPCISSPPSSCLSANAIFHSTCRFSQLLLLLSFKHILLRISLAIFKLRTVLLLCNFDINLLLLPCRRSFFSRLSLRRICFSTPTRSSSTLCLSPLDVSMNLHSRDVASCFPSLTTITIPS